ncbi:MAG: DNA mismatch repair protein MutL, partial [Chloroflexi bacterium]|nr:DNA mismatch repair protein MutL [Chloroflexota bacterium]
RVERLDSGRRLIRATDNGSGIPTAEVALALAHHAASKLASVNSISALGFLGEALASTAAVSQVACLNPAAL